MSAGNRSDYDDWQRELGEDEFYEQWANEQYEQRDYLDTWEGISDSRAASADVPRGIPHGQQLGPPF